MQGDIQAPTLEPLCWIYRPAFSCNVTSLILGIQPLWNQQWWHYIHHVKRKNTNSCVDFCTVIFSLCSLKLWNWQGRDGWTTFESHDLKICVIIITLILGSSGARVLLALTSEAVPACVCSHRRSKEKKKKTYINENHKLFCHFTKLHIDRFLTMVQL